MTTKFQIDWLDNPEFKEWIQQLPNDFKKAKCSLCHSTFSLSNMGTRALRSHAKSSQHQKRLKAMKQSLSLQCFAANNKRNESQPSVADANHNVAENESQVTISVPSEETPSTPDIPRGLKSFLHKDEVTKAEILWCLETVIAHKSARTSEKDVSLFHVMFPDSKIAKDMQLKRSKIGYSLVYGIAPYFKAKLIENISKVEFFSIGFDESLNKVSQKIQMDINVRFWCNEKDCVYTRYLTSAFIGRSTANDLRENFKLALSDIKLSSILQISMDGPNVNHKFLRDLKAEIAEDSDESHPVMLNMGTCGLHVLHGAFKTSMKSTNWNLVGFLRSLYNLFKNVPTRRALFVQYSGSQVFPLKFCPVRWLQNGDVAQRAIDMIPHLKLFVSGLTKDKIEVNCASFRTVSSHLEDSLLEPKLVFFKSVALEVEPFLREYQTDVPLVPFLHSSLQSIISVLMEKFVKDSVLKDTLEVHKVDMEDKEHLLPISEIDLGFATRGSLRKKNKEKKLPDKDIHDFRKKCFLVYKTFITKVLERSPLQHQLAKAVTCFDPSVAANTDLRKKRTVKLLSILEENNWIDGSTADKAQREFFNLCSQEDILEKLKSYSRKTDRIDVFWRDLLKENCCQSIMKVMKIVMSLSHGNANVERGFSVNSQCLIDNLKEETLVSQRIVYDEILSTGKDLTSFNIPRSLVHAFRNAYAIYKESRDKRQREALDSDMENKKKKRARLAVKELEDKISKIKEDALKEISGLKEQISSLA